MWPLVGVCLEVAASPVTICAKGHKQVVLGETNWLLMLFDKAERREGGISLCYDVSGTSGSLVLQRGFEQQTQPDVSAWGPGVPAAGCSLLAGARPRAWLPLPVPCAPSKGLCCQERCCCMAGAKPRTADDIPCVGLFPAGWGTVTVLLQVRGTRSPALPAPCALYNHCSHCCFLKSMFFPFYKPAFFTVPVLVSVFMLAEAKH